jgi:hypothetical protein
MFNKLESLASIIDEAIDTHVHVGDDNLQDGGLNRLWSSKSLSDISEIPVVGKAHFLPFVAEAPQVYGSVTLNDSLNPERVRLISQEMSKPFVVWFPSLNAKAHHEAVAGDDAWKRLFAGAIMNEPISILNESGELSSETKEIVAAILETGAILATGHLSTKEVNLLVPFAIEAGVEKIVLTHVSSRHNRLTVLEQKRLIDFGKERDAKVYAEHCAITWFDGKPGAYDFLRDFIAPISEVGPENCIVSSDCGRVTRLIDVPTTPKQCLEAFSLKLSEYQISETDLKTMLVDNPRRLLNES